MSERIVEENERDRSKSKQITLTSMRRTILDTEFRVEFIHADNFVFSSREIHGNRVFVVGVIPEALSCCSARDNQFGALIVPPQRCRRSTFGCGRPLGTFRPCCQKEVIYRIKKRIIYDIDIFFFDKSSEECDLMKFPKDIHSTLLRKSFSLHWNLISSSRK
ncbi:uncharacterized protein LOC124306735 [Neodiprion virginianus]|uniref:uncharacterized protein LOC124306735 n=1 Tax=Neodiprion virginianus TaxID=2961670 RepID=UPI001EE72BE0|nr:uncharacterized protein LOC124306735 [Neodiprion virginianus]